jgi:Rrf2 family protein
VIKLNRTTEYGLIALRHISKKQSDESRGITSAREISDYYGLPFEITAKTLLRLKDNGLIQSEQGARGGYTLKRSLSEVTLAEFLELMEGPQFLVSCSPGVSENSTESSADRSTSADVCDCEYRPRCEIKTVMSHLNDRMKQFLSGIMLAEIADGSFDKYPLRERQTSMLVGEP